MPRFHNTLTRQIDEFTPIDPKRVTLYTCGPTVYNYLHVGNWVAYIRWDTLVRALSLSGYTVDRVMNITDVGHLVSDADDGEDKMEKGAKREGKTAWEIAEMYTADFMEGMKQLNLIIPEHITKATEHIAEQINLVKTLEEKGYTYKISDGVYFDTAKFGKYPDFARLDLDELKAGARVEYNTEKRNPADFALWKFTPEGQTRDMEWDSPWGKGFPGWHLECSAMAMKYLGETLDIHTGGIDHIPVHHTNEIAQSEASTGKQFANYWLHNSHLLSEGTKISKSLGNGFTLKDLTEKGYSPMDFRMFVLQSHYRTESNFTWDNLTSAQNRLRHWREIAVLRWQTHDTLIDDDEKGADELSVILLQAIQGASDALQDDLNTPMALKIIEETFTRIEAKGIKDVHHEALVRLLDFIDEALGLQLLSDTPDIGDEAKMLIIERQRAREAKDWHKSDELRDKLLKNGVTVRDTASGPIWSKS
jgi:cysteinyl-tRNA synthetase